MSSRFGRREFLKKSAGAAVLAAGASAVGRAGHLGRTIAQFQTGHGRDWRQRTRDGSRARRSR